MSSSTTNVCFNSNCQEALLTWRSGWRRRTGEYADLCDRCASAYEDGKFCETFHLNASGWRCCESCGKTPNPAWPPPPLHFLPSQPERMKDLSVKTWSSIAGSGGIDRYRVCDRLSTAPPEMKQEHSYERLIAGKLRLGPSETLQNGNTGHDVREQPYPFVNDIKPIFPKNDSSSSNLNLATASSSKIEADDAHLSSILSEPPSISIPVGKQGCIHSGVDLCGEPQMLSGKTRDCRGRNQLLPRYRPRITDEELQQISGEYPMAAGLISKTVITPLFEKMLSASDAGRIGRLVLPKKCAEAYFPPITQPEGLPLKVRDVKGKDWVFQFRYWPNNNSRMYVLEGITPCIQSMQLQAGDVVYHQGLFSGAAIDVSYHFLFLLTSPAWLEPEGKLVMGGRKSLVVPSSDQVDEVTIIGSEASTLREGSARNKSGDVVSVNGHTKEKILEDKPSIHSKRKNSSFGAKSKRPRIETEDVIELKITWKEAQGLMRTPAKIVPSIVVVEGCEFEEFERQKGPLSVESANESVVCGLLDKHAKVSYPSQLPNRFDLILSQEAAPVIGRPTIPSIDHFGTALSGVKCLPMLFFLQDGSVRRMCGTLTDPSKKEEITERDTDLFVALEGLDTLANLAIQGEREGLPASSENRTKHPRHKPGCTCIVCLQPPSGQGSKHEQSCDCVVCSSLKRRFKTLMERREKKQMEKEAEFSSQNLQCQQLPENSSLNQEEVSKSGYLDEPNGAKSSSSPLKGQIDLNIQPEREDDLSPGSDSAGPMKIFRQQRSLGSDVIGNLVVQQDGIGGVNFISCMALDGGHHKTS
ncbi:hypothetical protein DH2020_041840 [Rehmannia glutinosa]|uniref:TF-B3 domain-containing protein n=1 Tax=Rehmannia glutinosa TaxID=99300 RepID=A0ABR0UQK3_REHGL